MAKTAQELLVELTNLYQGDWGIELFRDTTVLGWCRTPDMTLRVIPIPAPVGEAGASTGPLSFYAEVADANNVIIGATRNKYYTRCINMYKAVQWLREQVASLDRLKSDKEFLEQIAEDDWTASAEAIWPLGWRRGFIGDFSITAEVWGVHLQVLRNGDSYSLYLNRKNTDPYSVSSSLRLALADAQGYVLRSKEERLPAIAPEETDIQRIWKLVRCALPCGWSTPTVSEHCHLSSFPIGKTLDVRFTLQLVGNANETSDHSLALGLGVGNRREVVAQKVVKYRSDKDAVTGVVQALLLELAQTAVKL